MTEQWIIRVHGRDYGPADLATLHEWKAEGRILGSNEACRAGADEWTTAAKIPGLFEVAPPPVQRAVESPTSDLPSTPPRSLTELLGQTLQIYGRGFFQYLCLTLLIVAPSLCAQLATGLIEQTNAEADIRTLAQGAFAFGMALLFFVLWPVYIAGIQIVTAELAGGDRISFLRALNAAMRFWPRVTALGLLVYGVFVFLTGFGLGIAILMVVSAGSVVAIFFALGLLVLQIWLFSRWFVYTLFWQQSVVLANAPVGDALRLSSEIARSRGDRPWHQRPLWRGAIVVSLWVALLLLLYSPVIKQSFDQTRHLLGTSGGDLQSMVETLKAQSQAQSAATAMRDLVLWLIQKLFQPLLGIAFVLIFLENRPDAQP